jgi:hypothetical protein
LGANSGASLHGQPSISRGSANAAMALADQQRKIRADLVASRTTEAGDLASLKVAKA